MEMGREKTKLSALKEFVTTHSGSDLKVFLDRIVGPFVLLRLSAQSPLILDLGDQLKPGGESFRLGRSKDSHIRFADDNISSDHAQIAFDNKEWVLEDLNSTNGTFVDDQVLPQGGRVVLEEGPIFSLSGLVEIEFFSARRFHNELDSRIQNPGDCRRLSKLRYVNRERPSERIMPVANGHPLSLKTFAEKHKNLSEQEFLSRFPCPFLMLLTSTNAQDYIIPNTTVAEKVVVQNSLENLFFWPLTSRTGRNEVSMGRAEENDLIFTHQTISKTHALFAFDMLLGLWTIQDRSSVNGVFIDGSPIEKPTILGDELCLRFGTEVLTQFMDSENFCRFMKLYALSNQIS
jgi:pSer/pThr/pTyr-binding forkhead associated (FHA) protein